VSLGNYTGEWVEGVRVAGIIEHQGQQGPWMLLVDDISPTISYERKDMAIADPIGNYTFTADNGSYIPERVEVTWHKRHPDAPQDILQAKRFWTREQYDYYYEKIEMKGQKIGPIIIPVRSRIPAEVLELARLPFRSGYRLVLLFALIDDRTVWLKWFLNRNPTPGSGVGSYRVKTGGDW
jgi:hypothetical protein